MGKDYQLRKNPYFCLSFLSNFTSSENIFFNECFIPVSQEIKTPQS